MDVLTITVVLCVCAASIQAQNIENDLVVNTINGQVRGRLAQTVDNGTPYYAFQGIPYAEPPIGDLRFRAPVPAKSWEGQLRTDRDEKKCIQPNSNLDLKGSEDCLYINVFTPVNATNLAVMFWIYGGAFIGGDSKFKDYAPDYFLEQNVVVVTFNYRVGIFGFLSTGDESAPGNYGLKDQILALKWTNENIEQFGGDSKKITIFGESAGSASVSYLLQTPLTEGLFQKAIMQSGTTLNLWALARNSRNTAFAVGNALDINTENSNDLVEALRKINSKELSSESVSTYISELLLYNPRNGLIFGPTLEPNFEDAVITEKSHELLKLGKFNRVPCIVGFNSEEGIPFTDLIDYIWPYLFSYDIFSTRLIPVDMNIESTLTKIKVALLIKNKYFGLVPIAVSKQKLIEFITEDQFVRPTHEYIRLLSRYTTVYSYRFSYEGELGVDGESRDTKGVGHAEDLNYLWRRKDNIDNPSESDLETRYRLVKLWTNFAKTSNPTPEKEALFQDVIWPPATFQNVTYLDIGKDIGLLTNIDRYRVNFWNDLYAAHGVPPFDTY